MQVLCCILYMTAFKPMVAQQLIYDILYITADGSTAVREGAKFKSGQMVVKKVKWTYFDAYLWQPMWNYTKKSMEGSKLSDLVFLQWEVTDWQELFAKNAENKGN